MEQLQYKGNNIFELKLCPVGARMPRQGGLSVTQNNFREMMRPQAWVLVKACARMP